MDHGDVALPKRLLSARLRADLAERRIKRKELARLTERSTKTIERWVSDAPEHERYRPTRAELLLVSHLTGYPISRYTGDPADDERFPLAPAVRALRERLEALEQQAADLDELR
jgi:transcriptional regulator with XRE-family HTH domain